MNDEMKTRVESLYELNERIVEQEKSNVFHSKQELSCLYLSHIAGSLAILADYAPLILACLRK